MSVIFCKFQCLFVTPVQLTTVNQPSNTPGSGWLQACGALDEELEVNSFAR